MSANYEGQTFFMACPSCGHEIEVLDNPLRMLWDCNCVYCGWTDYKHYYRSIDNTVIRLTEEDARIMELISDCSLCSNIMTWLDEMRWGMCLECHRSGRKLPEKKKEKEFEGPGKSRKGSQSRKKGVRRGEKTKKV